MTEIKYGVFCEDLPQRNFVDNFLKNLQKNEYQEVNFSKNILFASRFSVSQSKSKIITGYIDIIKVAFAKYELDLLIIAYDSDCNDGNTLNDYFDKFNDAISEFNTIKNKIILFIPVQCIEHWLLYLKDKTIQHNKLEKERCIEIKRNIYGKVKLSNKKQKPIVEELTNEMNYQHLIISSDSFKKFYYKIKEFLTNI